jgi:hypothetical protein
VGNPTKFSYQLQAAVSNGISLAQMPAAAGSLTLNGSLVTAGVAQLDVKGVGGAPSVARRVLVSSTGNEGATVFAITGTDRNGNVQTDTSVTSVLNGTPVYTALDFATVTAVSMNAAAVGNITVGTNGVGSSAWISWNWLSPAWALAIAVSGPAGTNYTWEHTYDDFNQVSPLNTNNFSLEAARNVPPTAWPNPIIQTVSGNNEARYVDWPHFGGRLTIVSGTGLVTAWATQTGIGSP